MSNKRSLSQIIKAMMMMAFLISSISCNKEDELVNGNPELPDPLKPLPAITTTVAGVIIDENGKPVADAEITVHGETTITGADGGFLFENMEVPGNRVVVESRKEGYFSGIRALTPQKDRQTQVRIVLMSSPVTHTFQAGTGSNAALDNGSEVQIPANGLVTATGDAYSGPVSMSVRYLDPTAGNFGLLVPGGDMLAQREDQSTSVLYSYGVLRVQMTDVSGEQLQLAPGQSSTLIMNIPADQLSSAPSSIPLWFFDEERGAWQEQGVATRDGDRYVGTVTHFTDWNCDDPTEGATIIGRLVDCDNNPAWGVVEFGQVTSDPQSSTESGESDGRFERRVPDGVTITVVITDPLMVTPLTQNERGKVIVVVPPLAPGEVYDVGDIQTFPCPTKVRATFKTKDGDKVMYAGFSTDKGYKAIYDPGESMEVDLPPNTTIEMDVNTHQGIYALKNIQTPDEGESLDLGIIDLSSEVVAAGDGLITGKTVCYGVPETQGQISVYWNDGNSSGVNYTSPEADGSFTIKAPANMSVEIGSTTESGSWTKTIQTAVNPGEETSLGTVELCENTTVGETSFRITGDGFNNALFNVVSNKNMQHTNGGLYYPPPSDVTLVSVIGLNEEIDLFIYFKGNTTGVRNQVDETIITIQRKSADGEVYYYGGLTEENNAVNLNITRYDAVGGVIEGTFSGSFLVQDEDKKFTGESVTITDGKFSVIRYPDAF